MLLKKFKDFKLNENDEVEFTLDDDVEAAEKPVAKEEKPAEKKAEPAPKEEVEKNTSSKYEKLKEDIKKMLDDTGNKEDILKRAKDESVESLNIKGLTQESDIYDFYLAHQFEIDEKLNETDFFQESMESRGINSLYTAVILGTEFAIKKVLEDIK